MVLLKKALLLVVTLTFISSCSAIPYLFEQGVGQFSLLSKAKPNQEVLDDPNIEKKYKDKIIEIDHYKKYFSNYFDYQVGEIYSKTAILDQEAVTYLVILSPKDKIEAIKHQFIFVGSFPYLGFFKKESALKFKSKKEREGLSTYVRPVYAYSTLGYLKDPILSSFFFWDKYDLAETIFHELFHTFLFFKDEVDFNENLANFVGVEMMIEYFFKNDRTGEEERRADLKREHEVMSFIVTSAKVLNELYEKRGIESTETVLERYNKEKFIPGLKSICGDHPCPLINREWNNATFAAYMTYEKNGEAIRKLYNLKGLPLKGFIGWIKEEYKKFTATTSSQSFEDYLLGPKS